ncbi:acyltransferase family protein [Ruegeria arenilitoris]|uniref:acyltransferase family protein n=1 Tax=Ruegeria arenilitoris TaxID=1173585 RepID=UPI001480580E|nr:acyltransferase [Ruegeria arenilitoris]
MPKLSEICRGRDNNLNLIRAVAATAVLVSHAWPITQGPAVAEPLYNIFGRSLGTLAVYVFFGISGFLITASFQRSSSRISFVLARVLRLFPALAVNLLLVAFLLGPLVTTLSFRDYMSGGAPLSFVLHDLALFPLIYTLPGVFTDQPVEAVVGSIWTLRHEVLCYLGVFLAGLIGFWTTPFRAALALAIYVVGWLALALLPSELPGLVTAFHRLSVPFAIGIAFWIWRDRIILSFWPLIPLAALAWITKDTVLATPSFILTLVWATFWLAYIPGGAIRKFNNLGDYSYGIYVYAFPIQGLAVYLFGPQSPLENILFSLPPTLALSILSWQWIEAPSMAAKPVILRLFGLNREPKALR